MAGEGLTEQVVTEVMKSVYPDLRVDFVRHGEAAYTADDINQATIEGYLTEVGKRQVKDTAFRLSGEIDKEKECVVFWVSPKNRALQTAQIMEEVFVERGIPIHHSGTTQSLRDIQLDSTFIQKLFDKKAVGDLIEFWYDHADSFPDTESPAKVRKRVEKVITYLERIARMIKPLENKRLRFICVGHEEIFRDLLEAGYGFGTRDHSGAGNAEVMEMDIQASRPGVDAVLRLKFRDRQAELRFNPQRREFYKKD